MCLPAGKVLLQDSGSVPARLGKGALATHPPCAAERGEWSGGQGGGAGEMGGGAWVVHLSASVECRALTGED